MRFCKKVVEYINKHVIHRIMYHLLVLRNWKFCKHMPLCIRYNIRTRLFMMKHVLERHDDEYKYLYHLVYDHNLKLNTNESKLLKTYNGDTFIYTDRFGEESTITWKEYKKFMINEYSIKCKDEPLTVKIPRFMVDMASDYEYEWVIIKKDLYDQVKDTYFDDARTLRHNLDRM